MMATRGFVLLRVAYRAERIRLRLLLRRLARRGMLAMLAAVLALNLVVMLHIAALLGLARLMRPVYAALLLAGLDACLAAMLLAVALRVGPGATEREAGALGATARRKLRDLASPFLVLVKLARGLRSVAILEALIEAVRGLGKARD